MTTQTFARFPTERVADVLSELLANTRSSVAHHEKVYFSMTDAQLQKLRAAVHADTRPNDRYQCSQFGGAPIVIADSFEDRWYETNGYRRISFS
jgi:hypothetical protein